MPRSFVLDPEAPELIAIRGSVIDEIDVLTADKLICLKVILTQSPIACMYVFSNNIRLI